MLLLSRNSKIQNLINKLIQYKSPVLCKTQQNLFKNYASWNTVSCTRTARKLPLKVNKGKGKLLLSKNVKIEYLRNKLMKYKSPVLWKMQPNLLQNCANWNTRKEKVLKPNSV